MNRSIRKICCSCGGNPVEVETLDAEEKQHGCGRRGCCVNAFKCDKCGVRWTFALESPEVE
jgi:hypothetical protein